MVCKWGDIIGDLTGDGRNEIILTYGDSSNFKVEFHKVKNCSFDDTFQCSYEKWDTNYLSFDSMTAVPFLLDIDGNTIPEIFIFEEEKRFIVKQDSSGAYM